MTLPINKFDSTVKVDLGVMTAKNYTARVTEWVACHWIPQFLPSF